VTQGSFFLNFVSICSAILLIALGQGIFAYR
jgi:hypothetical protein